MESEWLITNGLGGYASSTILGVNTRKYHGLLVAALNPPVDRRVLLCKLDEEIIAGENQYSLGSNEFRDTIYPQGYKHATGFKQSPLPTFSYRTDATKLKKTNLMPYGRNATITLYETQTQRREPATLRITPLINSRHFHDTATKDGQQWKLTQTEPSKITLQSREPASTLILSSNMGTFKQQETWIENVFYRRDSAQGTSCFDVYYTPGRFEIPIKPTAKTISYIAAIAGSNEDEAEKTLRALAEDLKDVEKLAETEAHRLDQLVQTHSDTIKDATEAWWEWMLAATDCFLVERQSTDTTTVIAGYPWFEDWGRDSLISLPGLTLVTERFELAKEILLTFQNYCWKGVIPNRFPDQTGNQPTYNTVDATLWYVNAVFQYLTYTSDFEFIKKRLWDTLQSIVEHHQNGTINGIRVDNDGLLLHGPQLTWMDATVDNEPITPRKGKAVEIQALWLNTLKVMELLANHFKDHDLGEEYRVSAEKAEKSFLGKFWLDRQGLADVVKDGKADRSIRPNQILAVSLPFTPLDTRQQKIIINEVRRTLWTPYGLRTLSDDDSKYKGTYAGNSTERNNAYHNGTVWPWLLGPFTSAYLRHPNHTPNQRDYAYETFLKPLFQNQISKAGLGNVSEVFDGDFPHLPRGCIAQAWSVAEPLRAYVEDVLSIRPRFEEGIKKQYFK
jgi:predicted glycogen debranching enzyme